MFENWRDTPFTRVVSQHEEVRMLCPDMTPEEDLLVLERILVQEGVRELAELRPQTGVDSGRERLSE